MYFPLLLTYVVLNFCIVFVANANYQHETWEEPNVWSRHSSAKIAIGSKKTRPVCQNLSLDDGATLIFYKKFVSNLFNRDKLQYFAKNGRYQRSIMFTLSAKQLEMLENSSDPRDMDAVLEEILSDVTVLPVIIKDYFGEFDTHALLQQLKYVFYFLETTEVRLVLVVAATLIFTWFLHRRYNIRIISIVLISCFAIGFLATYYECNQKLEAEKLSKIMDSLKDPVISQEETSFWVRFIPSYFYPTKNIKRTEIIHDSKKTVVSFPFCRPDRVLQMYVNDMFITQFQFFIEKCVSLLLNFKTDLPFPLNFLYPFLLVCLGAFIIKLFFKYILSPKVWWGVFYASYQKNQLPKISESSEAMHTHGDRLSGENLKLLLTALKPSKIELNCGLSNTSGVQEIAESIEHYPEIPKDKAKLFKTAEEDPKKSLEVVKI